MVHIEEVEIKYFRSIYRVKLVDLKDISVFSGKNDIGKSNILKALNLFFNNETDWLSRFDFAKDYSRSRLEEVRKTVKQKQFIQVSVKFIRGNRYEKSLPPSFTVTRTWQRESNSPVTRSSLDSQFKYGELPTKNLDRAQASLQRFLGTFRYEYIPAIKDNEFFSYMVGRLQDIILGKNSKDSLVADAVEKLNSTVEREVELLKQEFKDVVGIDAAIRLPEQLAELFKAFAVATESGNDEIPIHYRGDGIRTRFIPSLLHYITTRSNLVYIWGFEEPENSLEHAMATRLAKQIVSSYSKSAQIFTTSHSPAFFSLATPESRIFRVIRDQTGTITENHLSSGGDGPSALEDDLGLLEFQKEHQRIYEEKLSELNRKKDAANIMLKTLAQEQLPKVLTEGKWDVKILNSAWKALYGNSEMPFKIYSCDPMPEHSDRNDHTAGGVDTLRMCLETVRFDSAVVIGIFDRDQDGMRKGFEKLSKNFSVGNGLGDDVKLQKVGTSAAIILPVIVGREKYAEILNLPMEFYFADEVLKKKIDGEGIILEDGEIEQTIISSGVKLPRKTVSEPEFRRIKNDSKKVFAEKIVPTLSKDDFLNFEPLFENITRTFEELGKIKKSHAPQDRGSHNVSG